MSLTCAPTGGEHLFVVTCVEAKRWSIDRSGEVKAGTWLRG